MSGEGHVEECKIMRTVVDQLENPLSLSFSLSLSFYAGHLIQTMTGRSRCICGLRMEENEKKASSDDNQTTWDCLRFQARNDLYS